MIFGLLIGLLIALTTATTEQFTTNNRQVSASWSVCDSCKCDYSYVYAFEQSTANPPEPNPPVYLYYSHSSYNNCNYTYSYEWYQNTAPVPGLEISRSGRSAELVANNLTDSIGQSLALSLSFSTADSNNQNNCNCKSSYSYGAESVRTTSKSAYRNAQVTGSVTINGIVQTLPNDASGYIHSHGQKTIVLQHH